MAHWRGALSAASIGVAVALAGCGSSETDTDEANEVDAAGSDPSVATYQTGDVACLHFQLMVQQPGMPEPAIVGSTYAQGGAPMLLSSDPDELFVGLEEPLTGLAEGETVTVVQPLGVLDPGDETEGASDAAMTFEATLIKVFTIDDLADAAPSPSLDCSAADFLDQARALAEVKQRGEAALAAHAQQDGVRVSESGLQIREIEAGPEFGATPEPGERVCVHYRGTFINGEEFDSSYGGDPAVFSPFGGLIEGWLEALPQMRVGDHWELLIPYYLAYGVEGRGSIGPFEALQFELELLDVLAPGETECFAD